MSKLKIGLALGGGGARGAAHIGVLKVLHNNGVIPDVIGGTSAGAIVGAMYAATKDPEWIDKRFKEFLSSEEYEELGVGRLQSDQNPDSVIGQATKFVQDKLVFAIALTRSSIIKKERLSRVIDYLIPVKTFEELKIPFNVFATDLHTGETICYNSGDLIDAVTQSSSIPGFVEPTKHKNKLIVDAGVSAPLPVRELKDEANFIIGVDISRGAPKIPMKKVNMIEIITRADRITSQYYTDMLSREAGFLIRPDVLGLHWSAFNKYDLLFENGIKAANDKIVELKGTIKYRKSLRYRLFHLSSN
ncbi:MAG: patatin-like phospholipase family protein [Candidatus Marinimicrobia bacterium]|nr:patatin-like phospholipase family protein [Candidatus Neomarinimicrobiota bacterium]